MVVNVEARNVIRSERLNNYKDLDKFKESKYIYLNDIPKEFPCICVYDGELEFIYVSDLVDNYDVRVSDWEGYNYTCEEFHS